MRLAVKSKNSMTLMKLLKRRKTSLKVFLLEQGITTYSSLQTRCREIGVEPPKESEFYKTEPPVVSNPLEGLLIIDPPPLFNEKSGQEEQFQSPVPGLVDLHGSSSEKRKKKLRQAQQQVEQMGEVEVVEPHDFDKLSILDRFLTGSNNE